MIGRGKMDNKWNSDVVQIEIPLMADQTKFEI
jgi:hypothetical protein